MLSARQWLLSKQLCKQLYNQSLLGNNFVNNSHCQEIANLSNSGTVISVWAMQRSYKLKVSLDRVRLWRNSLLECCTETQFGMSLLQIVVALGEVGQNCCGWDTETVQESRRKRNLHHRKLLLKDWWRHIRLRGLSASYREVYWADLWTVIATCSYIVFNKSSYQS
jgi:hypothetical protein